MFIRHGTSYPNSNESLAIRQLHQFKDRVIKNHEERKGTFIVLEYMRRINFFKKTSIFLDGYLCRHVLDSLKRWEFEVNPTSEDDLSPQGKMDMELLAKRTRGKMSEVLVKELNQNNFKVNS